MRTKNHPPRPFPRALGRAALCLTAILAAGNVWAAADPVFSPAGPAAAAYGEPDGYPMGPRIYPLPQRYMVGQYSHFGEKYPSREVARADIPSPWKRADLELTITYNFDGASHDLEDYLARNPATGLLIARGDTILYEHYQYGRTDRDQFLSQSMAKTVVGMLIGIAVDEGAIRSIDQPAEDYVPALRGSEYGKTPIRALLHMASGVAFTETYDTRDSDNYRLNQMLFGQNNPGPAQAAATFNTRVAAPDTRFHYASVESEVLGLVLADAVKMPLADYLRTRIWQPMGAEADAAWTTDTTGQELGFCCLNVVLRDWARLGMMLANDGAWNGKQIVPRQWVLDATTAQAPFLAAGTATPMLGYGYQTWILPAPVREFALLGIHGQTIFVDPAKQLVLVQTAVLEKATGDRGTIELSAIWRALLAKQGG